jgi:oligoendopeptidase F
MAKQRDQIAEQDCWDTGALFPSVEAWEKAFGEVNFDEVKKFQGQLGAKLQEALKSRFDVERKVEKLFTYAHLRHDENLGNGDFKGLYQRAIALLQQLQEALSWFEPELLALDHVDLAEPYRFYLEKIIRLKEHTLPAREEELLAMAGQALAAPSQAFGALTNVDFKFPPVADATGEEHELTQGSYALLLHSSDRELRRGAFETLQGHFGSHSNTLAELLGGEVQSHLLEARARHFPSCLEAALTPKNVPTSVYHSLIEAVHEGLPALHRYMRLRKRALGVDELELYDMHVPLVSENGDEIPYDAGAEDVIASVTPLGAEYQETLRRGMNEERWVDRYENVGKRSGAYSSGCYDSHPYILMNYHGLPRDVFTLAHEAGHSMHSYLSREAQPYHYASYPIFVAEVASTFNEELLMRHWLASDKSRATLINQKLDDLRNTLFRQAMFAEFELWIHERAEQGVPITPDALSEEFFELNRRYFGPDVNVGEEIGIEWARIPHFYYNFYVYQYATGISAAMALAESVVSGGVQERDSYLAFLSSGYSDYPVNLLQKAGVDVTTREPVQRAIKRFESLVEELEGLIPQ